MSRHTLLAGLSLLVLAACAVMPEPEPEPEYAFNESGILARNEAGMSPGIWYLRHGGETDDGFFIRLSFDDETVCVRDGEEGSCPRSLFETGLQVTIRGDKAGDGHIEVRRMEVGMAPSDTASYTGTGFTVEYPTGWTVREHAEMNAQSYSVQGTSFIAPAQQTTLYEGIFHVAPHAVCPRLQEMTDVTVGGTPYRYADWAEGAAGTLYEGETFSFRHADGSCAVITLYARSCNIGDACEEGRTTPYDKNALFRKFHDMLETLRLG